MIALGNHEALNMWRAAALQNNITGIYRAGQLFQGVRNAPLPKYRYLTARFTEFEKFFGRFHEQLPTISAGTVGAQERRS